MDDKDLVSAFLSKFSYEDWSVGDDGVLRIGDYVLLVHFDNYTGNETHIPARIDLFDNGIPVFVANEDPEDEGDSGEFISIFESYLNGYFLVRISREEWLTELTNGLNTGHSPVQV